MIHILATKLLQLEAMELVEILEKLRYEDREAFLLFKKIIEENL